MLKASFTEQYTYMYINHTEQSHEALNNEQTTFN